ncbi:MAG: tetratricopeptide repeat protein, partial [Chloroflexota bacterium]
GEAARTTRAHALYFHGLAKAAEPELTGSTQARWLARLESEHDNLRAALAWALAGDHDDRQGEQERVGAGLRLAGHLWRFWSIRGYTYEGRAWLERLLAVGIGAGSAEAAVSRATALRGAAALAYGQGDFTWSMTWAEESLALYQSLHDRQGIVRALQILALTARDQGDLQRALRLQEHVLMLNRELGDSYGISVALHNLGAMARDQGDYPRAAEFYAESLAIKRSLGDRLAEAISLNNLADLAIAAGDLTKAEGYAEEARELSQSFDDKNALAYAITNLGTIALLRGDFARARAFQRRCLALRRELGDKRGEAGALTNLGHVAYRQGRYRRAGALFRESLRRHQHLGPSLDLVECLGGLARTLYALGRPERATTVLGATAALYQSFTGNALLPSYLDSYDQTLALTRAVLGDDAFTSAWTAGAGLPIDQILLLAAHPAQGRAGSGNQPAG